MARVIAAAPPGTSAPGRIVVDDLTKIFRGQVRAVDKLSFAVEPGSVTGFLGPNGAGKTTTLRMVLGLVRPSGGRATIGGEVYRHLGNPSRTVGAALESSSFHPARTGRNHLRIMCTAAGLPTQRADEVLDAVGLGQAGRRKVRGYSLGMRQRLGLAAALLGDPRVLVLDEPANGLDPEGIRWLRGLLRHLAEEGRTVLVSSHQLNEVQEIADRVVILNHGQLVRAGTDRGAHRRHRQRPGPEPGYGRTARDAHPRRCAGRTARPRLRPGHRDARRTGRPPRVHVRHRAARAQHPALRPRGRVLRADAVRRRPAADPRRTAMIRLVRAEFLKVRTTQVWFWLLLGVVAVSALLVIAPIANNSITSERDVPDMFSSASTAYIVVFVLGVLGVTTEFRYQTITGTVLQTPSRWAIITAKLITYAVLGVLFALVALVTQLVIAVPWLSSKHVTVDFGNAAVRHVLLAVFGVVALFGIVGLGVGALLRNQIVAVVVGILFLLILENLLLLIPHVRQLWLYTPAGGSAAMEHTTGSTQVVDGVHLLSTWGGVVVLVLWALVPALVGAAFTMNRDIT